jgi:hypothetical protein
VVRINGKVLRRLIEPLSLCFSLAVTHKQEGDGGKEYADSNAYTDCDTDLRGLGEAID